MEIPGLGLGEASEPSTGVPKMELGRTDLHFRRAARARGREETPNWSPQNMWCFSVLFCVAKCESEIAKTGRRRILKDENGRSHPDLAIRSLGSPVNLAFALSTAVYAPAQKGHAHVRHLSGRGVSGESEGAKTPLCITWRYGLARSRRGLTICIAKGGACSSGSYFGKRQVTCGDRVAPIR